MVARTTLMGLLLPIHFACDLTTIGMIGGNMNNNHKYNSSMQFQKMVDIALWLLTLIGDKIGDNTTLEVIRLVDVTRNPPLTIARQLLHTAQVK